MEGVGSKFIKIVNKTLSVCGIHVVNIDLTTTPTAQLVIIKKIIGWNNAHSESQSKKLECIKVF